MRMFSETLRQESIGIQIGPNPSQSGRPPTNHNCSLLITLQLHYIPFHNITLHYITLHYIRIQLSQEGPPPTTTALNNCTEQPEPHPSTALQYVQYVHTNTFTALHCEIKSKKGEISESVAD